MGIRNFTVRYHDFKPVQVRNNIVLARCNCCSVPRYAVFIVKKDSREFWYHGYDNEYAQKLFNFLVSKSQVK